MAGRNLHADTSLILRHNGVVETGNVDTFFLHLLGINLRKLGIVKHYGADSALRRLDVKAGSHHLVAEVVYVLNEFVVEFVAFLQDVEGFDGSTNDGGSYRVREEVGT